MLALGARSFLVEECGWEGKQGAAFRNVRFEFNLRPHVTPINRRRFRSKWLPSLILQVLCPVFSTEEDVENEACWFHAIPHGFATEPHLWFKEPNLLEPRANWAHGKCEIA